MGKQCITDFVNKCTYMYIIYHSLGTVHPFTHLFHSSGISGTLGYHSGNLESLGYHNGDFGRQGIGDSGTASIMANVLALVCAATTVWSLLSVPVTAARSGAGGGLQYGFYSRACPNVEQIIYNSMVESFKKDSTVPPGVLRLSYHDCFVRGCDGSVLLNGTSTEKTATINAGLHGFDAIDAAKAAVEEACPGVVSCADVLQFAVRDSVVLTGGQSWTVPAGRRDGTVSLASEVAANLMGPNNTVPTLLQAFQRKGLNAAQMVALAGAHTIGKAPCLTFDNRLWTYPSPSGVDPTLPASFAATLKKECPTAGLTTEVDLEITTPTKFDTQYYKNIENSLGLLTSDQSMWYDSRTKGQVQVNTDANTFTSNFQKAMIQMSQIGVLTGSSGQIRRQCAFVN